jgi:hypothetical protein
VADEPQQSISKPSASAAQLSLICAEPGQDLDLGGSHIFSGTASIYSSPAGQPFASTPDIGSLYSPAIFLGNMGFLQGIFVHTAGTNLALWSLANEFWYYIAFPPAVAL